jgi:hypothetical protein
MHVPLHPYPPRIRYPSLEASSAANDWWIDADSDMDNMPFSYLAHTTPYMNHVLTPYHLFPLFPQHVFPSHPLFHHPGTA